MSHSDGAVSSPEQAAATDMVKDRRITELAHASKDAWCSELSFSLDAEKAFIILYIYKKYTVLCHTATAQ
jgi:hypothetical protein